MTISKSTPAGIVVGTVLLVASVSAGAADHFISAATSSFDCKDVRPGDTLTLAGQVRGPLRISNCEGSADAPIVIRNDLRATSRTVIRRESGSAGGFVFHCSNCSHVVIDGTGKWSGAPSGSTYGIMVTMSGGQSPSSFLHISGLSHHFAIRGVEIDGAWPTLANDGVGIQVNDHSEKAADHPGVWREGILIEKNYVHNVEGEGLYIGPNWSDGDIPLRNVVVRFNLVEDTGWDGIQVKSAYQGENKIHGNVVRRAGARIDSNTGQHYGISLAEGRGSIFGNWVEDSGEMGIHHFMHRMPSSFGPMPVDIFNNVVVNSGRTGPLDGHGIISSSAGADVASSKPRIFNNTVVRSEGFGILVGSTASGGEVRNNIVVSSSRGPISVPSSVLTSANRTGAISDAGFMNEAASNYRLKSTSVARDAGDSRLYARDDFDGIPRPQDNEVDVGAFEYSETERPLAPAALQVL